MALFILALLVILAFYQPASAQTSLYQLTFIDVGQGDAALLRDPNGFTVLIDGGKTTASGAVISFLSSQGISTLDVVLATHPDSDHIGGLIGVIQSSILVKEVVTNGYPGDTQTWTNFVSAVNAEGATMTVAAYPQTLTWGIMQAVVINPISGLTNPDTNNACLAVLVSMGSVKSLFACDLETAQESVVLTRLIDLEADILKVAHHGSNGSSSTAFLEAVSPKEAVISVGQNDYGHPGAQTIARLENVGARIWRTDEIGDITILTDGATYTVNSLSQYKISLPLLINSANPTAPPQPGEVVITNVFFDGVLGLQEPDEYVEIKNVGGSPVQLQGWALSDVQNHVFTFPSYFIQPDEICRVYTDQDQSEYCGFNYRSGSAIWNNNGDMATLKDNVGQVISTYTYP